MTNSKNHLETTPTPHKEAIVHLSLALRSVVQDRMYEVYDTPAWKVKNIPKKTPLTREAIEEYFRAKPIEHWVSISPTDRRAIQINGHALGHAGRLFGIYGRITKERTPWWAFLSQIFREEIAIPVKKPKSRMTSARYLSESSPPSRDEILQFFHTQPLEYWLAQETKSRETIHLNGYGLYHMATTLWLGSKIGQERTTFNNHNHWRELLAVVFDSYVERVTESGIRAYFRKKPRQEWENMSKNDKYSIKIRDRGILHIARKMWITGDIIGNPDEWNHFLDVVYDESLQ